MTVTIVDPVPVKLNERLILALAHARAQGRSAAKVAALADVHPSEVSRWAYGHRSPTPAQAARVAQALGCEVSDIFPLKELSPAGKPGSTKTTDAGGRCAQE